MEYRTIEGVELATVGENWPTSAGEGTFTFENLADAAEAANHDPHIQLPKIKLGHVSEVNGELKVIDPFKALGDAAPSFGAVRDLTLTNGGAVCAGEFFEMPAWLADAAPSAWRSRSIEAMRDVTTEGGKRYSMVITAVSLLGTFLPAVSDLEELERVMVQGFDLESVAAKRTPEEGPMADIAASVDAFTIRQRFNFEWTLENDFDGDTYWWWCREVRIDPHEIIADDDEGNCWSVPYETDGKDKVTFGEPTKVRPEYVPVNATATKVVAAFRDRKDQTVLATNLERPDKPAPKTAASSQPDPQEDNVSESTIDMDALRKRLGLPDDASDDQINEALGKEPETTEPVPPTDETPAEPEAGAEAQEAEPVAANAANERGVTVDKDALATLQTQAKAGQEARATQLASDDSALLSTCVDKGRIPPSSKASYDTQLSAARKDELAGDKTAAETRASIRKFLEELPDNTIPVSETGEAGREDGVAASAGLPDAWFHELDKGAAGAKED